MCICVCCVLHISLPCTVYLCAVCSVLCVLNICVPCAVCSVLRICVLCAAYLCAVCCISVQSVLRICALCAAPASDSTQLSNDCIELFLQRNRANIVHLFIPPRYVLVPQQSTQAFSPVCDSQDCCTKLCRGGRQMVNLSTTQGFDAANTRV